MIGIGRIDFSVNACCEQSESRAVPGLSIRCEIKLPRRILLTFLRESEIDMARGFGSVLLVYCQFGRLQQDLRLSWGDHRLYDTGVAVYHRYSWRRPLNAEIEHQTARRSTGGPSKPLGARCQTG
jgi:hypothetical protein